MFIFYFLGVRPPCPLILCQFWLCEEAQCVYLRLHLGSPPVNNFWCWLREVACLVVGSSVVQLDFLPLAAELPRPPAGEQKPGLVQGLLTQGYARVGVSSLSVTTPEQQTAL